jgi:hypothetical protein
VGKVIKPQGQVVVGGRTYVTQELIWGFKALMNGYFGWTSVWADTLPTLERRIRQARSGGQ